MTEWKHSAVAGDAITCMSPRPVVKKEFIEPRAVLLAVPSLSLQLSQAASEKTQTETTRLHFQDKQPISSRSWGLGGNLDEWVSRVPCAAINLRRKDRRASFRRCELQGERFGGTHNSQDTGAQDDPRCRAHPVEGVPFTCLYQESSTKPLARVRFGQRSRPGMRTTRAAVSQRHTCRPRRQARAFRPMSLEEPSESPCQPPESVL